MVTTSLPPRFPSRFLPQTFRSPEDPVQVSLCQDPLPQRGQRVVDLDKVLLAVVLQDEGVEVQADPVARLRPQPPLQVHVGGVRGVWEAWRLDLPPPAHVHVEGLPHWREKEGHTSLLFYSLSHSIQ